MSPILKQALKSLSVRVNVSAGLAHPLDSDTAKELFIILRDHGEVLLKVDIEGWAIENGWKERHADNLGSLAQQIGEGKRVQIKNKGRWKDSIIEDLEARIPEQEL